MITILEDAKPDVICISALPPLAFSHARNLYLRLRALFPEVKILIGLWGFSGDTAKITRRMRLGEDDGLFVSLRQVIAEIDGRRQIPEDKASEVPVPSPSTPMSALKI